MTYECSPSPTYSLSTLPSDQEVLRFYEKLWSTPIYEKTLASSSEFVCATFDFYSFLDANSRYYAIFYLTVLSTLALPFFRHSRIELPLSKVLFNEATMFIAIMSGYSLWMAVQLIPLMKEEELKYKWNARTAMNFV